VVGYTYPGAVYVKDRRGSSRARGVPRRRPRPSCSTAPAGNPTNEHIRIVDTKQGRKGKLGNWDGGGSAHWEQEEWTATKKARASPPTHPPAAQPTAGRRRDGSEVSPSRSLAGSRVQLPRPTLWHPPNSCLRALLLGVCARS
jgi:hypothetical protein